MSKKANHFLNYFKHPLLLWGCLFFLSACATTQTQNVVTYQNMDCSQILAELETLNSAVSKAGSNSEVGRAVDTGASVAVTGASVAGVPYVGAVYSIGKTLWNHTKVTRRSNADIKQQDIYNLEGVAYEKNCL